MPWLGLGIAVAGYNPAVAGGGAPDTTPPTLSSPVGTKTGSTTATIGATTNEGNGTMYGVVSTSSTAPTAVQVEAGQMHTGAAAAFGGSVAVSSTGAKTISATGLSASTTYYAHIMHKDAAGNRSSVSTSASFTTDAAGAWAPSDASTPASVIFIASTSSCFTNQAGTTPVSADGDTVQCIKDTNGNIIAHLTLGTYPLYRTNSGKPYLDMTSGKSINDGSGDQAYALTDGSGNGTFGTAVRPLANSGEVFLEAGHQWARTYPAGPPGPLVFTANGGGGPASDAAGVNATANSDYRMISRVKSDGAMELWVNGSTDGPDVTNGTPNVYSSQRIAFIGASGGNGCRISRFAGFPGALNSTDITNLDAWLLAGQ